MYLRQCPARQHDAAELLQFLVSKQPRTVEKLMMHWQARAQQNGSYVIVDGGCS